MASCASSSMARTADAPAPMTSASTWLRARTRSGCSPRAPAKCTSSSTRLRKATTRLAYTSNTDQGDPMRIVVAAVAVLWVLGGAVRADSSAGQKAPETQKQKDIRKLLKITGSGELGTQVMSQMIGSMKKSMPQVPEKFWGDFMKEVHTDELVDLIVPVYDRNLTQDDVKELIRF